MKKKCILLVLTLAVLLTFYGCKKGSSIHPTEISASSFTEGEHLRDAEYGASFQTKSISLENLNIHFANAIFDETESPVLAQQIAADYAALAEQGDGLTKPADVYLVSETTTGQPVVTVSGLFCTVESVKDGTYRPFLTSCTFGLTPWWQCVGLSQTVFAETAISSDELSERLRDYDSQNEKSSLLTLSPIYFIEEFTDAETRELAEQSAQSLSAYILSHYDRKTFLTEGNSMDYRNEWLQELGVNADMETIRSPEAAHLSNLPFRCEKDVPFVIEEQNFRLNLQSVDWMPSADDALCFLQDFYSDMNQLYRYLEENAPKHYGTLQQPDTPVIAVSVFDSNAGDHSYAKIDGSEAVILDSSAALHEFTHCLIPSNSVEKRRWLVEGLTEYLSLPYLSYEDDKNMVDSFASEEWANRLSDEELVVKNEVAGIYEQMTGQDISHVYKEKQPVYLLCQAIGYEVILHPESMKKIDFPLAQMSVSERADRPVKGIEDELSYPQAMVFTQYLVDKYGLDTMIEAEMDIEAYHELFPDTAAFQKEYDAFAAQLASAFQ